MLHHGRNYLAMLVACMASPARSPFKLKFFMMSLKVICNFNGKKCTLFFAWPNNSPDESESLWKTKLTSIFRSLSHNIPSFLLNIYIRQTHYCAGPSAVSLVLKRGSALHLWYFLWRRKDCIFNKGLWAPTRKKNIKAEGKYNSTFSFFIFGGVILLLFKTFLMMSMIFFFCFFFLSNFPGILCRPYVLYLEVSTEY